MCVNRIIYDKQSVRHDNWAEIIYIKKYGCLTLDISSELRPR